MKRRKIISIVLCVAILLSAVPIFSAASSLHDVDIICDGVDVTEVSFEQTGSLELEAKPSFSGAKEYQWQILAKNDIVPEGIWVDILDENDNKITLTYALLANALEFGNDAEIRCAVTNKKDTQFFSDPVNVTVQRVISGSYEAQPNEKLDPQHESGSNYCNITIDYEYEDGTLAYQQYLAQVLAGSNFTDTVIFPVRLGYLPYLSGETQQDSMTINIPTISADISYKVIYKPADVDYTVHFLLQGIYNDKYDEDLTVAPPLTLKGKTGTDTPVADIVALMTTKLNGFEAKYTEPITIQADGSTELYIEYDRCYYLLFFDLEEDAYGTEAVYARYGTEVTINDPSRPGYVFKGWLDKNGDPADPKVIPAYSMTYTPVWEATETSYTVVYWVENADDDNYSYLGSCTINDVLSATYINGYDSLADNKSKITFPRDFDQELLDHIEYHHSDEKVLVNGDGSTIVNVYYNRKLYTINFVWTGVCHLSTGHVHTAACLGCGMEEHAHSIACYTFSSNVDISSSRTSFWFTPTYVRTTGGLDVYRVGTIFPDYYVKYGTRYYPISNYSQNFTARMSCGKTEHAHVESCYVCDFKDQDANVHQHDANCTNSRRTNLVKTVTAKYDADLTNVWKGNTGNFILSEDGQVEFDSYYDWRSSITGKYYVFLQKMPGSDLTMTAHNESGSLVTWYYYLQVNPEESLAGLTTKTNGGKTYKLYHTSSARGWGSFTYDEDYFPITGFTQASSRVPSYGNGAIMYYNRNQYNIEYHNADGMLDAYKKTGIYYESSLAQYNITPPYPSTYEENAYEFVGWYTSEGCFPGTEFDFSKEKMPAHSIILYAKYQAKKHTVRFYTDSSLETLISDQTFTVEDDSGVEHTITFYATQDVWHNNNVSATMPPEIEYNGVGLADWYYIDPEGNLRKFSPSMRITRDMDIFAEWDYSGNGEYTIYYKLENDDGLLVDLAPSTYGQYKLGRPLTVYAKTEESFYPEFLNPAGGGGYFPMVASHVITIAPNKENTYTFVYKYAYDMGYTVKYVDKSGAELAKSKFVPTFKMVVSEQFLPIKGYIPDEFQKSLHLVWDKSMNVITFVYSPDATHAYYNITYYLQNADDDGYTVYQSISYLGDIGSDIVSAVLAKRLNITGFTYVPSKSVIPQGNLTTDGMMFKFYYDRVMCPYTVNYYKLDTVTPVATVKTSTARYEATVTELPAAVKGYEPLSESISKKITSFESNVIDFYYIEQKVTIKYAIVAPLSLENGTLMVYDANTFTGATLSRLAETFDAVSGTPLGSTVNIASGSMYTFEGWYSDAECTQRIESGATGTSFVPQKTSDDVYVTATYYAKLMPSMTKITVSNTGAKAGDTFLYRVTGTSSYGDIDVDLVIEVHGNGSTSVNIPVGEYTVTEIDDWSWRYGKQNAIKKFAGLDPTKNVYSFSPSLNNDKYLSGGTWNNNVFDGKG